MAFFNGNDDEEIEGEVRISMSSENQDKNDTRLKKEAESKLTSSDSGSTSSDTMESSSSLPGVSSTGSSSSTSSTVDLEDVHSQNERIIDLLKEIKDELGDSPENELL